MAYEGTEEENLHYLRLCLAEARKSPPKPSNFCVGALLLDTSVKPPKVLCTGYTLELQGNTHAEQNCLNKWAASNNVLWDNVGDAIHDNMVLFTTMEPCWVRLSGNLPCVQRISRAGIKTVVSGVREPEKFVGENEGRKVLEEAGVTCIYQPGLEEEILAVATAGHPKSE